MSMLAKASSKDVLKDYPHRIIVAGSRHWDDFEFFSASMFEYLKDRDILKGEVIFISGNAPTGADALIIQWCKVNDFPWVEYDAMWDDISSISAIIKYTKRGKAYNVLAGHWRNEEMSEVGNALVTFYDGASTGTKDMMKRMAGRKHPCRCFIITQTT
jgi:hypothetical protein